MSVHILSKVEFVSFDTRTWFVSFLVPNERSAPGCLHGSILQRCVSLQYGLMGLRFEGAAASQGQIT